MHKATVFLAGFRAFFTALFVLNFWLKEIRLSSIANRFKLRCKSKAIDAIVLPNLSLFGPPSMKTVYCASTFQYAWTPSTIVHSIKRKATAKAAVSRTT